MSDNLKIRFITDSTCDIPDDLARQHNISIVPVFVNFNGNSYADDGLQLDRAGYYQKLGELRPIPTTSAMPPGLAEEEIEKVAKEADHIFIITVSAKLSGVNNAMRLGASKLPSEKVTLIDSMSTTMGMGWQVLLGAQAAHEGGSVDHVKKVIMSVQKHQRVYAALPTLEFLHRGGRVSWASAGIGTLLQIKPIIMVQDGEVHSHARVRTFSRAVDELVKVAHEHAPLSHLAILYGADADVGYVMRERLSDIAPADTKVVRITPAIGTHIGPNGIGIVPVSAAWKQGL
jgi:DegV family protein with EDD domain